MRSQRKLLISILLTATISLVWLAVAITNPTWASPGFQGTVPTPREPTATRPAPEPGETDQSSEPTPTDTEIPLFLLEPTPTETETAILLNGPASDAATPTPTMTVTRASGSPVPLGAAAASQTKIPLGPNFIAIWDPVRQVLIIYATTPGATIAIAGTPLPSNNNANAPVKAAPTPLRPTAKPTATRTATPLTVEQLKGKIVYKSDRDGAPFNYYSINPDGSDLQKLDKAATEALINPLQAREGLSPDGSKIVLGERRCGYQIGLYTCALYVLDTTLNADEIYSGREPSQGIWFTQNKVKAKAPVWSPRGDYILFVSNHETPPGCRPTANLFKGTPTQKPVIRRLTEFCAGADTDHPSVSPDGSQVVFASQFPTGNMELFIVDVGADDSFDFRSTSPRLITPGNFKAWDPLWIK